MKKIGAIMFLALLLALMPEYSYAKLSVVGSDFINNKVVIFPSEGKTITNTIYNVSYANSSNSSNYLIGIDDHPYIQQNLISFWAFKYADSLAPATGLYFNITSGQFEFQYLGDVYLGIGTLSRTLKAYNEDLNGTINLQQNCEETGYTCTGYGINFKTVYDDGVTVNDRYTYGCDYWQMWDEKTGEGYCGLFDRIKGNWMYNWNGTAFETNQIVTNKLKTNFFTAMNSATFNGFIDIIDFNNYEERLRIQATNTGNQKLQAFNDSTGKYVENMTLDASNVFMDNATIRNLKANNSQINSMNTTIVNTTKFNAIGEVNLSDGAIARNLNVTGIFKAKRAFWYGYDNSTQSFQNTANVQIINISNNKDYTNWSISVENGQNLTFRSTGAYLCTLSPEFFQNGGGSIVTFWMQKNGADVAWSNSRYTMTNNEYHAPSIQFAFTIEAPTTDYIRFMWWSDNTGTQIYSSGPLTLPTRPSIPGIILDCRKNSELPTFGG